MRSKLSVLVVVAVVMAMVAACAKKVPPVARPEPPPVAEGAKAPLPLPVAPPKPVAEPLPVPPEPLRDDGLGSKSLDDINRQSPLLPVYFELDTSDISSVGQQVLQANAQVLRKYPTMKVTIEGHCDERGTVEYNYALGWRRAVVVKDYLVSLGIPADRVGAVGYGNEFPFDPGHDEAAWSKNRRAHFVITAK